MTQQPAEHGLGPADLTLCLARDPAAYLEYAVGLVRGHCGWHIAPERTETITVTGDGSGLIILPTLRLTAVLSVVVDAAPVDLETAPVRWTDSGLLRRGDYCTTWPATYRAVAIEITHGYDTWPPEVKATILASAARAQASPTGAVRETSGPNSVTQSQPGFNVAGGVTLLEHEKNALERYRLGIRP